MRTQKEGPENWFLLQTSLQWRPFIWWLWSSWRLQRPDRRDFLRSKKEKKTHKKSLISYSIWNKQKKVLRRYWLLYSCMHVWKLILPSNQPLKHSLSLSHSPVDDSQCSGEKEKGLLHSLLPSTLSSAPFNNTECLSLPSCSSKAIF